MGRIRRQRQHRHRRARESGGGDGPRQRFVGFSLAYSVIPYCLPDVELGQSFGVGSSTPSRPSTIWQLVRVEPKIRWFVPFTVVHNGRYIRDVPGLIIQYSYLQILDFLTTVAFLLIGVQEGNPMVRFALEIAPTPLTGLIFVKLLALGLGFYCLRLKKEGLLAKINLLFAVVVAWNLVALIVASCQRTL